MNREHRVIRHLYYFYVLRKENPYKTRVYKNYLERGVVSAAVEDKLRQLRERGSIVFEDKEKTREFHAFLKQKIPHFIDAAQEVDGIGVVGALRLCSVHGILSMAQLKRRRGEFSERVRNAIEMHGVVRKRVTREEVRGVVRTIRRKLSRAVFEVCGSYRRGKEVVKDIDVVFCATPTYDTLQKVLAPLPLHHDLTSRSSATKYMGYFDRFRIDIRIVPPRSYPFAVLYFTGSAQFNVDMRRHAKQLGYRLNEYGLEGWSDLDDRTRITTEKDIFRALRLPYTPPHKRSIE